MKIWAYPLLVLALAISNARAQDYGKFDGTARDVSLVQLIVQPEKYLDTTVAVRGALHWEFEGQYLFLSRDHLEEWDTASAVWLARSKAKDAPTEKQLEECSDALVRLEGRLCRDASGPSYYLEVSRVTVFDARRSQQRKGGSNHAAEPSRTTVAPPAGAGDRASRAPGSP